MYIDEQIYKRLLALLGRQLFINRLTIEINTEIENGLKEICAELLTQQDDFGLGTDNE